MIFSDSSSKIQKLNLCKHHFFSGAVVYSLFFSVMTAVNYSSTQIFAQDLTESLRIPFPPWNIKLRHLNRGEEVMSPELGRDLAPPGV